MYTKMKFEIGRSGINGTVPLEDLDLTEQRIIGIITLDSVDGDGETDELGVTAKTLEEDPIPSTSSEPQLKQRCYQPLNEHIDQSVPLPVQKRFEIKICQFIYI